MHTMNELIQRGKIFYWGTSEFSPADLESLYTIAARDGLVGPTMEQTCHSMLNRARVDGELLPVFQKHGLGTTIYSPLAIGILTGKYNNGIPAKSAIAQGGDWMKNLLTQATLDKTRKLSALAAELGMSLTHLALAWCLKNPNVSTAIIGATRPEQVIENVAAVDQIEKLTTDVMQRIEVILK